MTAEAVEDARRYAAHLEAEIARARAIYDQCACDRCSLRQIAAVFGWDAE